MVADTCGRRRDNPIRFKVPDDDGAGLGMAVTVLVSERI